MIDDADVEARLRAAYRTVDSRVGPGDIPELHERAGSTHRRAWLATSAAGVAAAVGIAVVVVPGSAAHSAHVQVTGQPTGTATSPAPAPITTATTTPPAPTTTVPQLGPVGPSAPPGSSVYAGCGSDQLYEVDCDPASATQIAAAMGVAAPVPSLPAGWSTQAGTSTLSYGPFGGYVSKQPVWGSIRVWSQGGPAEASDANIPQVELFFVQVAPGNPTADNPSDHAYVLPGGAVAYGESFPSSYPPPVTPAGIGNSAPVGLTVGTSSLEWVSGDFDYTLATVGISKAQILAVADSLPTTP